MATPQMQLTIDQMKELVQKIGETDESLLGVMKNITKQVDMVESTKTAFNKSMAKVASRTLGDIESQRKAYKQFSNIVNSQQEKQKDLVKQISDLQNAGDEESLKVLEQKVDELKKVKINIDYQKKAYQEIANKNLQIIDQYDKSVSRLREGLNKVLQEKDSPLAERLENIGEKIKDNIESAISGNVEGLNKLLGNFLKSSTTKFEMYALKLAEQGQKDTKRIEELELKGSERTGEETEELKGLQTKKVSSEKSSLDAMSMAKGMTILSAGIMAVVTAFKMMIDAEAKVKEFNKEMIEDAGGSLSFLRDGSTSLSESLNEYREGFASMANTVGMKASEIKQQFTALQDTTFFNKERLKDFDSFERSFKTLATYSKGLGIAINETTEMAESFAESMAIDVSTQEGMQAISESFQDVGLYASKSNLSTKAFANQLKEVNSKSSTFNKSIAQTSSIMIKLNKTLGATSAKHFLESITDFKEQSQEELIKTIAMTGGPQSKQFQKIAQANAKIFTGQLKDTFAKGKEKEALQTAVAQSGLKLDLSLPVDQLVEQFKGINLGGEDYIRFIGELQKTGETLGMQNIPELIQKIEASVKATKATGATTYQGAMTGAKEFGFGATFAMQLNRVNELVTSMTAGKEGELGEITDPIMLNALKEQTGLDQKAFDTLIMVSKQSRVDFLRAEEIKNKYASASADERAKMDEELSKLGTKVELGAEGTYQLLTKNSDIQISSAKDMTIATGEIIGQQEKQKEKQVKSEQELMQEQVDATWGMGDRIEAGLGVYLEQLNSYVARILSYITSWFGSQNNQEMKTQQRLQEEKISEKEKYERQLKEEKQKLEGFKKAGKKDEIAKSEERIKELSRLKEVSQSELELLQKGATLKGTKTQQEIQLATTKRDVASKAFGEGTTGAKLGALKESLGKSTNQEVLDLLDEMRDIYEQSQEEEATPEQLEKLKHFQETIKASGLQLQLGQSGFGTEFAKIFDDQGRELFASVEGYMEDENKSNLEVLHKELLSSRNKQKDLSNFFKDLGANTQEEAEKILESYRSDILEQENDPFFNKLTKEQEEQKKKIEDAMKKHGIQTNLESSALTSNLTLSKGDEKIFQTSHAQGQYVSETMKEAFNPALFAKAQTEENRKNRKETVDTNAEGIQQGLEKHELSKTTTTLPITPMNDFIWREKGGLQSFSPQDNVIGFKDQGKMGSAINNMMAGNTTNNNNRAMFNININGGNKDEVLKTITDALKRAGVVTERTSYA
jgi:hypothetical protein